MIDKKDECINNVPTWTFSEYLCISTSQVLKLGNWKIDIRLHAQIHILHLNMMGFLHWELN